MEQYTYVKSDNITTFCPMAMNFEDFMDCAGPRCMAWIIELDGTGKPTGRGRCGMGQQQIFVTMPGVSTPYDTPSRHWWEANRVEG